MKTIKYRKITVVSLYLVSFLAGLVSFSPQTNAQGLSCDDPFYYMNEIWAYRPTGCDDECSASPYGTLSGSRSLPESTTKYLDDLKVKDLLEKNKERYQYAREKTGVSWQAIAALHWREAQLDPEKSIVNGNKLGEGKNDLTGEDILSDPKEDAVMAAEKLVDLSLGVYEVPATSLNESSGGDLWGKAFLAYHAGAVFRENSKDYQDSTYVVNGLDQDHLNMSWLGEPFDLGVGVDSVRAGSLTFLKYIGGVRDTLGCAGAGVVAGNIIATAKNLALSTPADQDKNNPKKTNETAKDVYLSTYRNIYNRLPSGDEVTDCGRFVSVVVRSSKADPNFPAVGTDIQYKYMSESDKYLDVTGEELLPGDILVYNSGSRGGGNYSGHIMIYTGGTGYVAVDASLGQRVPSVRPNSSVEWMKDQPNYSAWRLNG